MTTLNARRRPTRRRVVIRATSLIVGILQDQATGPA
jgi:hypothetical protein